MISAKGKEKDLSRGRVDLWKWNKRMYNLYRVKWRLMKTKRHSLSQVASTGPWSIKSQQYEHPKFHSISIKK